MYGDEILMDLEFERGLEGADDLIGAFRERNGEYRLGCLDDDPEMDRFDEMVDLAASLR